MDAKTYVRSASWLFFSLLLCIGIAIWADKAIEGLIWFGGLGLILTAGHGFHFIAKLVTTKA